MTVLTFPTNPINGQRYSAPNGIQYVYDGVKWVVETTSSSSGAITNAMQDRVAPMFVNGDNSGITFTYNATTNVMSAEVTSVNGNQLVNGDSSFSVSSDGTLTLTHPPESDPIVHPLSTVLTVQKAAGNYHTISGAYGLSLQATPVPSGFGLNTNTNFVDIFHDGISVNVNDNTWTFGTGGDLTFPSGGKVIADSQDGTYLQANPGSDGYAGLSSLTGNSWMWTANDGDAYISSSDGNTVKIWSFNTDGKLRLPAGGDIVDSNGTTVLGGGLSVSDFGQGFTDTLDAGKITTSKLYNKNPNPALNNQYELSVDNGGVVHLPDQSVINGATLKTVAGNYAGITAGPVGHDEDSWVWVDNDGAWIATKFSTTAYTWHFDNNGKLTLPTNGTISYAPDDTDNWNVPAVNTISAALDELALRLKAVETIEIEGGNAYAMAGPELILDGNGA